jgi:hypothetical protein
VLGALKPNDRARALAAMAPLLPDHEAADWSLLAAHTLTLPLAKSTRRELLAALATRWRSLAPAARAALRASGGAVRAARDALKNASPDTRASIVELIAEDGWQDAPDLLLEPLADPDPEVARTAGAELLKLAERAAADPAIADAVDVLIGMAVESFDLHQARPALSAALAIAAPQRAHGGAWAAARRPELRPAVAGALRSATHELFRVRAWERLADDGLTPAAASRLAGAATVADHEAVLPKAHLALRAARSLAVKALPDRERSGMLAGLIPLHAAVLSRLSETSWCGMLLAARTLDDQAARRETLARAALGHPSPQVRALAARVAPARTAADFAFDPDERIALIAAARIPADDPAWPALRRSPHARIRALAFEEVALAGGSWGLSTPELFGLRRRLAADEAGFLRGWREAWDGADDPARTVLVRLAARLMITAKVPGPIIAAATPMAAAGSPQARTAATAAAILGPVAATIPGAGEALASCLESPDTRVRANAVEALGPTLDVEPRRVLPALLELKGDPNHRVRANAVRALAGRGLLSGSALLREVARMLVGPAELDRRAGAWLAERLGSAGAPLSDGDRRNLATIVERRLMKEDQEAVAHRLAGCAARILADLEPAAPPMPFVGAA